MENGVLWTGIILITAGIFISTLSIIEISKIREKNKKILYQKRSSEITLGLISEKLSPFLKNFRFSPENLQFLGNPVDYVHFNRSTGEVTFIEVKSGKSKLTKIQRLIRDAINNNEVYFKIYRIPYKLNNKPNN